MNILNRIFLLLILLNGLAACEGKKHGSSDSFLGEGLIWGEDNRQDYYEKVDTLRQKIAPSIGMIVYKEFLKSENNDFYLVSKPLNQEKKDIFSIGICSDERFRNQINPGSCSGFLVAPQIFATAGHCIGDLSEKTIIFNYSLKGPGLTGTHDVKILNSQIYHIKRVLQSRDEVAKGPDGKYLKGSDGEPIDYDYAFLELDRPVVGATPLPIETTWEGRQGDPVMIVGHPEGLPMKFADGASIEQDNSHEFFATLDAFVGNSGSLVWNLRTQKAAGIYFATSKIPAWVYDNKAECMRLRVMSRKINDQKPMEISMKLSKAYQDLNSALQAALRDQTPPPPAFLPEMQPEPSQHGLQKGTFYKTAGLILLRKSVGSSMGSAGTLARGATVQLLDNRPVTDADGFELIPIKVISNPQYRDSARIGSQGWLEVRDLEGM